MAGWDSVQGTCSQEYSSLPRELTQLPADLDPSYANDFSFDSVAGFSMDGPHTQSYETADQFGSTPGFYIGERSLSTNSQTCSPSEIFPGQSWECTPGTDLMESPSPALWSNDPSPVFTVDHGNDVSEPSYALFGPLPGEGPVEPVFVTEIAHKKPAAPTRKGSSPTKSPGKSPRNSRTSLNAGIAKKKASSRPLPDIKPDPNNPKEVKKARNTLAARNSRARKMERLEALQAECQLWKDRAIEHGYREKDEE
ncbi:MAG: hypothetical protein Q9222_006943 [Ikaeria aurantiellina]